MCEARTRAFIDFPPVPECVNEHVWFTCLYCNRCGRFGNQEKQEDKNNEKA